MDAAICRKCRKVFHRAISKAMRMLSMILSARQPAFFMQIHRDDDLADSALRRLRRSYPRSRIMVVSDGTPNTINATLVKKYGAEYTQGEWLYGLQSGGKMIQRMLDLYLGGVGSHLIKMDTDTRIDRRLSWLPKESGIYGTPLRGGPPQGGCIIMPRSTALTLAKSGVFLLPELCDFSRSWGKLLLPNYLRNRVRTMRMIGFEWVLYWGCSRCGIPVHPHNEVHSTWKEGIPNNDHRYAIIHPDKFMNVHDEMLYDCLLLTHNHICALCMNEMYTF